MVGCCVCMQERDAVMLVPCGHVDLCVHCVLVLCGTVERGVPRCPVCGVVLSGCVAGKDFVELGWRRGCTGLGAARRGKRKRAASGENRVVVGEERGTDSDDDSDRSRAFDACLSTV